MNILDKNKIIEIQLENLRVLHEYCKKEKLVYFLGYGTLLGAVRHKGYIPWDDDIDVIMPRPDYEKFIKSFNKSSYQYKVYSIANDPDCPFPFAKLSNEDTLLVENTDIKFSKLGINIDIFPLDGVPSDKKEQKKIMKSIKFKKNLLNAKLISINKERDIYKNLILYFSKLILFPINYRTIVKSMEKVAISYDYKKSENVGCTVGVYESKEIMSKEIFSTQNILEFEGETFNVPVKYETFLTNIYGDYMELPPIEKRITHHSYKAYEK